MGLTSRSVAVLAPLLASLLAGCGASPGVLGAATTRTQGPAHDPAALAAEIDQAQAVVDDGSASPASLQEAGRSEQLAFRELAVHPPLRRPTLARLSAASRSAAVTSLRAAQALAKILPVARRLPHWRIISPPAPGRLLGYFHAAGAAYRIPWQYLAAIELVETRMGRIHGLSSAGAQGPMQFMPSTWAEYGHGSIDSQRDSIMAAARFLAANGGRRRIGDAIFHYNPAQPYVTAVEAYAREMRSDPRAFYGYYEWQVFYRMTKGTFVLPVGYPRVRPERLPR